MSFCCSVVLYRDILELRNLMSEMQRRVDIKPWMIEPPADYKIEYAKSRKSVDSDCGSSDGGMVSVMLGGRLTCVWKGHIQSGSK